MQQAIHDANASRDISRDSDLSRDTPISDLTPIPKFKWTDSLRSQLFSIIELQIELAAIEKFKK